MLRRAIVLIAAGMLCAALLPAPNAAEAATTDGHLPAGQDTTQAAGQVPDAVSHAFGLLEELRSLSAARQVGQQRSRLVGQLLGNSAQQDAGQLVDGWYQQRRTTLDSQVNTAYDQLTAADPTLDGDLPAPDIPTNSQPDSSIGESEQLPELLEVSPDADPLAAYGDVGAPTTPEGSDAQLPDGVPQGADADGPNNTIQAGPKDAHFDVVVPEPDVGAPPPATTDDTFTPTPHSGAVVGANGLTCPVPDARWINDWGFPRSGGRTHKGNDLFAPTGSPVYAVNDGIVRYADRTDNYQVGTGRGDLGGISLSYYTLDGTIWYSAHLDGIVPGLQAGTPITAGQLVGWVGNTGNAATTPPHVHLQMHPGGGAPVNPFPTLQVSCNR